MELNLALAQKYSRPGPRYTSYPTAPHLSEDIGPSNYAAELNDQSTPVTDEISDHGKPVGLDVCLDRVTDIRNPVAHAGHLDPPLQGFAGSREQLLRLFVDPADRERFRGVSVVTLVEHAHVDGDDVALLELPVL